MSIAPKRRGVESVDPASGDIEQADHESRTTATAYDIERESLSPDTSSVETITDERGADPFADERNNIERS